MIEDLLHNKDFYGVKYFIKDLSLLEKLDIQNIQLYKVGETRRLGLLFKTRNIKQYCLYKSLFMKEKTFVNMSCKDNMFSANFVADKKFNIVIDMIIDSRTLDCISKERMLELCETLIKKPGHS